MRSAIKMTETAKNNTFDNCKINGWIEIAGKDNKFKNCVINWIEKLIKENPIKTITIWVIIIIIGLLIEYTFFK